MVLSRVMPATFITQSRGPNSFKHRDELVPRFLDLFFREVLPFPLHPLFGKV